MAFHELDLIVRLGFDLFGDALQIVGMMMASETFSEAQECFPPTLMLLKGRGLCREPGLTTVRSERVIELCDVVELVDQRQRFGSLSRCCSF